jgi:hypothetical protein
MTDLIANGPPGGRSLEIPLKMTERSHHLVELRVLVTQISLDQFDPGSGRHRANRIRPLAAGTLVVWVVRPGSMIWR